MKIDTHIRLRSDLKEQVEQESKTRNVNLTRVIEDALDDRYEGKGQAKATRPAGK